MKKAILGITGGALLAGVVWFGLSTSANPVERPEVTAAEQTVASPNPTESPDSSERAAYEETLRALRQAERARVSGVDDEAGEPEAEHQPSDDEESAEPTPDEYTPEMPRPGTRTSSEAAPSQGEQQAFFDALFPQINPMINECYGSLPAPRPEGTLNLVWSVIYEEGIGTVAEQIELDEITEITNEDVLTCVRESIFGIELPSLAGFGRLQITSNHHFDGEGAEDREIER